MMDRENRKKLGEILIDQCAITREQLDTALVEQKRNGKLLGEILIDMNMLKEEDIVIALATQFNFPYLPIENFEINPLAIKAVPVELACKYLFVPIDKIKTILTVVMSDPANDHALAEIETHTQCRIQPFVATVTEIKKAIRRHYKVDLNHTASAGDHVSNISFQRAKERNQGAS